LDANGELALRIEGPVCTYSICGDVEFKVLSPDGSTEVGKISKQWSGLLREAFTDSDNFGISFPMDLVNYPVEDIMIFANHFFFFLGCSYEGHFARSFVLDRFHVFREERKQGARRHWNVLSFLFSPRLV